MNRMIRSALAAALLTLLVVGVPLLTWRVAGWPLPSEVPTWGEASRRVQQGDVSAGVVLRVLAVVVWVAWAQLVWALGWELLVNARRDVAGRLARPAPFVFAPISVGAARLLAVVLAVGTVSTSMPTVALAPPAALASVDVYDGSVAGMAGSVFGGGSGGLARSASSADQAVASGAEVASASKVWRADRYDSVWSIAEQALGDGRAVDELLTLNPSLSATHTFRGGESVLLPEHAAVPAERRAGPPVDAVVSSYRVEPGDGMWNVAEALLGDGARHAELARLVIGQEVAPGVVYRSVDQVIQPGWVFTAPIERSPAETVVVESGDSLWSIAAGALGDPGRWSELWELNQQRVMDDGRTFDDPDLIHPGWTLVLPSISEGQGSAPPRDIDADSSSAGLDDADGGSIGDEADESEADQQPDGGAPGVGGADVGGADVGEADAEANDRSSGPVNVWNPGPNAGGEATGRLTAPVGGDGAAPVPDREEGAVDIVTFERAAMLSAGVLALLGVRRRDRLRRSRPRATLERQPAAAVATERALRAVDAGERFARVDLAVRAAAMHLVDAAQRVVAVSVAPDGEVVLTSSGSVDLPLPWSGAGRTWTLPAITPLELLAPEARRSGAPCPTLVQLGRDVDGRDIYVDLEAVEAIEVDGPVAPSAAIVNAVAATLAASAMAEVTSLVTVDVPEDALFGHRHHRAAETVEAAFDAADEAVGSTRSQRRSTFELRALGTSGEAWEPAVVLIGPAGREVRLPADRRAVAVVSAAPIIGPSSRLAPVVDSDAGEWELLPLGIRFVPIGLPVEHAVAINELVDVPDATIVDEPGVDETEPADLTIDASGGDEAPEPVRACELLVTTFGGVSVVDAAGASAEFERSKTRELIAWLVTHRHRSTRSSARTALWEMDVRDATFANVVSEARRAMARLVHPPEGEEWIDRTLTDDLPLHPLVWSDADVIEQALDAARVQPPTQAIATLRPAVDLIDGIPFAGTAYLWPDAEGITSRLVLLATTATSELAAHCLSVGDIEGVFAATARGLQVLPGHEELIALRMRAHARAGDHAGVRAEWESYERILVADPWSDGEPAPKLVDLRRTLLNP